MTDTKYNLHNPKNFLNQLEYEDITFYVMKYSSLLNNFFNFTLNNIHSYDECEVIYVIKRGLFALHTIFNSLLLYTKNVDLCVYHCQKSYSYYIEFVRQINSEQNNDKSLTINDAIIFLYRKTISEINVKDRLSIGDNDIEKNILSNIYESTYHINMLYNNYFIYHIENKISLPLQTIFNLNNEISKVIKKTSNSKNKINIILKNINLLFIYTNKHIEDITIISQILIIYINKCIKNNIYTENFEEYISKKDIKKYFLENNFTALKLVNYIINKNHC